MERINREKEKLYEIAKSGRMVGTCECMMDSRVCDSYYVRRDRGIDCLVQYEFEDLKELQEMLKNKSELLQDDEVKMLICVAAFKMKHIYDEKNMENRSGASTQELPEFIYNM